MKIGVRGSAGSGKTCVSNYLRREYGFNVYSFAYPIKEMEKLISQDESIRGWASELFPKRYHANAFKERVVSIPCDLPKREKWQAIGDAGRRIDENVFVDYLLGRLPEGAATAEANVDIVVDDARRDNEVRALFLRGFEILRLSVDPSVKVNRILQRDGVRMSNEAMNHPSEQTSLVPGIGMRTFDNSSELEDLYTYLDDLIHSLRNRNSGHGEIFHKKG